MAVEHGYDDMFEQALNIVNNRFLLSVLLAKRVTQLRKGAEPLVDFHGLDTHEEIVYREIVERKLEWRSTVAPVHAGEIEQDFMGDFDDTE
ncbi:MAG: hypothetical protein A3J27_03695 [Candidatus Tectomicrobia bacterium RIFCSPLOWO2_12_FULL_69_37]|nr:MAG: hypothetical protein A3J27_03695 [Candidatus Tectomicrobia bacterium RIFCSPLOWO2_12_FULL_69_37]